jgi:hypothetical protein
LVDTHIYDFGDHFAGERAVWDGLGATVKLARCNSEEEIVEAGKDAERR